jgi:WD40 repeat protein
MSYKAFISYSHAADKLYAPTLQSSLHKFAKPFYLPRAIRVFRDKTDLSANPTLWPLIQKALDESEFFIYLASPRAAKSKWVKREIDYWFETRNDAAQKFLIVWTDGKLAWDSDTNDFSWAKTNVIPKVLDWNKRDKKPRSFRNVFEEEPFYLNHCWVKKEKDLSLRNPRFLDEIATLAATLHGKGKSDLIGEDIKEHKKYRRLRTAAVALLAVFALLSGTLAVIANQQRVKAETALEQETLAKQETEERRRGEEAQRTIAQQKTIDAESSAAAEAAARDKAEERRKEAEKQTEIARERRTEAENQTRIAKEQREEAVKQRQRAEQQTTVAEMRRKESEHNLSEAYVREARLQRGMAEQSSAAVLAARAVELEDNFFTRAELGLALENLPVMIPSLTGAAAPISWAPVGDKLVTGVADRKANRAKLISPGAGEQPADLPLHGALLSIAWRADGGTLITGDEGGWLVEWSKDGRKLRERKISDTKVEALGFSLVGEKRLLGAITANRVLILSEELQTENEFRCNASGYTMLAWSPKIPTLAVLSGDGLLQIWNAENKIVRRVDGKETEKYSSVVNFMLAWAPDGSRLMSIGGAIVVKVWYPTGDPAPELELPAQLKQIPALEPRPTSIAWSPDGKRISGGGQIWTAEGKYIEPLSAGEGRLDWSVKTGLLAISGGDGKVHIWREDRIASEYNKDKEDHGSRWNHVSALKFDHKRGGYSRDLRWSGQGTKLAYANERGLWIWDTSPIDTQTDLRSAREVSLSEYVSPDRKKIALCPLYLVGGKLSTMIQIYDPSTRSLTRTFKPESGHHAEALSWAADNDRFVTAGTDKTVRLWSASGDGRILGMHDDVVETVTWSPDNTLIASAGWDGTVRIWEPDKKDSLVLRGHSEPVLALQWSPDGELLASGSSARRNRSDRVTQFGSFWNRTKRGKYHDPIRIWRKNGKLEAELPTENDNVTAVSWSPDAQYLAAPFGLESVRVWDSKGNVIATLPTDISDFKVIAWSKDSRKLALAGNSNTVWLYSLSKGLLGKVEHSNQAYVTLAAWSPVNDMLVTYGTDFVVRGWWGDKAAEASILSSGVPVSDLWWSRDGNGVSAIGYWRSYIRSWGSPDLEPAGLVQRIGQMVDLRLEGFETKPGPLPTQEP